MTLVAAIVLLGQGATAPAQLASDSRLDAAISIEAPCVPLFEFAQILTDQLHLPVSVAPDIRETLVVARWTGAARGLMESLADYFDWSWIREGNGYRLIRTAEQERAEEEQYRRERIALFDDLRAAWRKAYEESLPPLTEDEKRRAQEIQRAMNAITSKPENEQDWERYWELQRELTAITQRVSPVRQIMLLALLEAPDSALLSLAEGRGVQIADEPKPRQFALGPRGRAASKQLLKTLLDVSRIPLEERVGSFDFYEYASVTRFQPEEVGQVAVAFRFYHSGASGPIHLRSATLTVCDKDGVEIYIGTTHLPRLDDDLSRYVYRPKFGELASRLSEPLSREEASALIERSTADYEAEPCSFFAQMLLLTARKADRNLIAEGSDAYAWNPRTFEYLSADTVGAFLLGAAQRLYFEVEDSHGVLYIRHGTKPISARRQTFPRSSLRALRPELERRWGISLDRLLTVFADLTNDQIKAWRGLATASVGDPIYLQVRFWSRLSEPVRRRLLAGETVSVREISPDARRRLTELADDLTTEPWRQISSDPVLMLVQSTAFHYPQGLPDTTGLRLVRKKTPALGWVMRIGRTEQRVIQIPYNAGYGDQSGYENLKLPADALYPAEFETQELVIVLPDGTGISATLSAPHLTEDARPMRFEELPRAIRDEIEQGRERARAHRGGGG